MCLNCSWYHISTNGKTNGASSFIFANDNSINCKAIRLALKWSHLIGIRSKLWRSQSRSSTCVEKCYGFTRRRGGPECCEEGERRSSVCYRRPSLSLSAHLSGETSLTISQCSRSANAGFYKRCSARQQGVPRLRLMSTQMQADSTEINNLISLHLFPRPALFSQDSGD